MAIFNCDICNKEFNRSPAHAARNTLGLFCSRKCFSIGQTGEKNLQWDGGKVEKVCKLCNKKFKVKKSKSDQNFCSIRCRSTYFTGEKHFKYNKDLKSKCDMCGKSIRLRFVKPLGEKSFCNRDCANKYHGIKMRGSGNPRFVDGTANKYPFEFNKTLKLKIRKRDKKKCQICGINEMDYGQSLDVHHIDSNKSNNKESNLIALCKTCHSKVDGNRCRRTHYKKILSKLLKNGQKLLFPFTI